MQTPVGYVGVTNALPPGWEESYDHVSQRVFFIDHNTKTTTFERPVLLPTAPPSYDVAVQQQQQGAPPLFPSPRPSVLPPVLVPVGSKQPTSTLKIQLGGRKVFCRFRSHANGYFYASYKHVLDVAWAPEIPKEAVVVVLADHAKVHPEREVFEVQDLDGGNLTADGCRVSIRAANGQYLRAEGGGSHWIVAKSDEVKEWEIFSLRHLANPQGAVALVAHNGNFVQAHIDDPLHLGKSKVPLLQQVAYVKAVSKKAGEWEVLYLEECEQPENTATK